MAAPDHLLYTPEQAARSTLAALRYQSTLARLVNQDFSSQFTAGSGATVTVKRPIMIDPAKVYTKANRQAEDRIEYSNLYQPYTSLTLEDQVYNAVKLPDDFTTFTLTSLEQQVISPMALSVADQLNSTVVAAFQSVDAGFTAIDGARRDQFVNEDGEVFDTLAALRAGDSPFLGKGAAVSVPASALTATTGAQVLRTIRAAHQVLSQRGVPVQGRILVVGANWEAAIMDMPQLQKVNESGTDGLLRSATLGTLFGFTVVADYTIDPNDAWAMQRDAITLATRTTAIPRGVSFASTVSAEGFTLRYLQDYDPDILTDRAVVDTFAGAQVLDAQRILKLTGADSIVDNGGETVPPEDGGE